VGIPPQEIKHLSGVEIHPNIDYSLYSNNELLLAHTVCHNLFSLQKHDKIVIGSSHNKVIKEMENRGFSHLFFDKLDNI